LGGGFIDMGAGGVRAEKEENEGKRMEKSKKE
jgi:hypothetical protein